MCKIHDTQAQGVPDTSCLNLRRTEEHLNDLKFFRNGVTYIKYYVSCVLSTKTKQQSIEKSLLEMDHLKTSLSLTVELFNVIEGKQRQ